MQLDVISTADGLAEVRQQWEALEERDPHASYYVTHRCVSAWWAAHADHAEWELHVATISNNGVLVGIAPLAIRTRHLGGRTVRVLRFAGQGDYYAPVLDPDASGGAICREVMKHAESGAGWDRVVLGNIPATSRFAHHLLKTQYNPKFTLHVECPYVDLTRFADLADFEKDHLPAQLRNRRNKFYRECDPTFRVWRGNEDDILDRIAEVHRREKEYLVARKARTERHSLFDDAARLEQVRRLFADTDDAITFGLTGADDKLIGYVTCFEHRGTMLSWNTAYDPAYEQYRIGKVMHYETLAHLFREGGVERFDFGAGRYSWKFEWTGDFHVTYRLTLDLDSVERTAPASVATGSADTGAADQVKADVEPAKAPLPVESPPGPAAEQPFARRAARRLGLHRARGAAERLSARVRPPVIWYVPHPDDESLFMGGSIAMQRGRRNVLVALTRGGASGAIKRVNKRLKKPLDRDAFMRARMRELRAAAAALGVAADDVVSVDLPDGGLQVDAVRGVIEDLARRHPRASHRTLSYLDPHDDHRVAGEALRAAYRAGAVRDCRFHLPIPLVDEAWGEPVRLSRRAVAAKRAAIAEYEEWRPRRGRYAIGAQSVAKLIRFQRETPTERVHGPDYEP